MKLVQIIGLVTLLSLWVSCSSQEGEPDPSLAHVFQPLDGEWEGVFYIFEWPDAQKQSKNIPSDLYPSFFNKLNLKLVDSVQVTQKYSSESPYLQKVYIQDVYRDGQGLLQTITSEGLNKVVGKQLWCIVYKPDETVRHHGSLPASNTIIWQRNESNPLKVEYFKETVQDSTYSIIGYGYYGDDNPKKNPKTWFKSRYIRQ